MTLVLVVDDNPLNLTLASDVLESAGYRVLRARDADEALLRLEGELPDIVLMDIEMPGMDGLTLTRKLKADERTRAIPVVAVTASAMRGDEERAREAGCDGYIVKPIDTRTFAARVSEFVAAPTAHAAAPRHVLVVDDSAINRRLVSAILEAEGMQVAEATDGVEALEMLAQGAFDVVVSDVLMPRMDGYRLCYEIRRSDRLRPLPFIVYTSTYTSPADQKLAMEMGADRYFTKPAPAAVLAGAVRELVPRPERPAPPEDAGYDLHLMREYNTQLVAKLEQRNAELQRLTAELGAVIEQRNHLLAHSPSLVYSLDVAGDDIVPTFVSENVSELLGYTSVEATSYAWWLDRLHPEDRASALLGLEKTLAGALEAATYRVSHRDGTYRWVEDNRRVLRDAEGRPVEVVGVWTEVTDRLRAEASLRQSEERFRELAAAIPEVFLVMSRDMRVEYVSPAYERIFGRSVESLVDDPRQWTDAMESEDRQAALTALAELFAGQTTEFDVECRIRRPDDTAAWVHVRGAGVQDSAGETYRAAGLVTDITERKRIEDTLLRAQKLEAIGQLAGGVAHDFNNILACIMGHAELAAEEVKGNEDAEADIAEISAASHRAKELILQLLTFSRQQEEHREPIALPAVLAEALRLLRAFIPSTVSIRTQIAESATILGDATQVHQILMNLATNAVHALRGRGELFFGLAVVEGTAELRAAHPDLAPGPLVELTVGDTGTGMDDATLARIFEPFFTTKGVGEGTGLGLAVVHGIVESHGGAMTVTSALGKGTTFRIYFPSMAGSVAEVAPVAAPTRGDGERVLFVDDEVALVTLGRRILERAGYQVVTTSSSSDALAKFQAAPGDFDVVVADLSMPVMSGVELASQVLALRPGLPFVLATGFGGGMNGLRAESVGITEVLAKPYSSALLVAAVQRALAPR